MNADTEYYYRILQCFGPQSVIEVLPGVPLSFGRAASTSLSQAGPTHLRTQFRGVRKDYHEAARAWHRTAKKWYLPRHPTHRPFPVPVAIFRGTVAQQRHNYRLLMEQNSLFNAQWYLQRYPDVRDAGVEPLRHFIAHGASEGRDPLPMFSLSHLAYVRGVPLNGALDTWLMDEVPCRSLPDVKGSRVHHPQLPTLLMVGHLVSNTQFGAERSFLDTLAMLADAPFNIVVCLPSAIDSRYVDNVRQYANSVVIFPYAWMRGNEPSCTEHVSAFVDIIEQRHIDLVYVNTIVLKTPIDAAAACGVKVLVHVRELLEQDHDLCQFLSATPALVKHRVLENVSAVIANSQAVARWVGDKLTTYVVPNVIRPEDWPYSPMPDVRVLNVVMLSSNLPKKGLYDLVAIANRCADEKIGVNFLCYGPENSYVTSVKEKGGPSNLTFCGYTDNPLQAVQSAHVVLNLSHFQESFGRSVLEAMIAGRVVVAYEWGALPELVQPGTGYLVPFKDIDAVVERLRILTTSPDLLHEMGDAAHAYVATQYSAQRVSRLLVDVLTQYCAL